MRFLLDTTALSELTRIKPNTGLLAWMNATSAQDTFVSVLSIAEISFGIELLAPSNKRRDLESWLSRFLEGFRDRTIDFDVRAAREWSYLQVHARRTHKPLPIVDGQIAATAIAHDLTVLTRNQRHFQMRDYEKLKMLNPWT